MKKEKLPEIALVDGGLAWEGLYVNGELVNQNHNIKIEEIIKVLQKDFGLHFRFRHLTYDDNELARRENEGLPGLPEKIKDLKRIKTTGS